MLPSNGDDVGPPTPGTQSPRIAVLCQVFYEDLWPEVAGVLRNAPDAHVFVNLVQGHFSTALPVRIWEEFPDAVLTCTPNRGFDVGPFLHQLAQIDLDHYDFVCKVHTKRGATPHLYPDGEDWRRSLFEAVLGSPERVGDVLRIFKDNPDVGLIGSAKYVNRSAMGGNAFNYAELCRLLDIPPVFQDLEFIAGTVFWIRSGVLKPLQRLGIQGVEFEPSSEPDGQKAHAVERIFGALAAGQGYRTVGV